MDNLRKRCLFFILSFLLFISPIMPSFVSAHNAYYLQIVIDKDAKRVVGQVVYDEVGHTWGIIGKVKEAFNIGSTESSHDEFKLLQEAGKNPTAGEAMKMTFPSKMVEKEDKIINHGGAMDADRATRIANELIPAFNDYLQSLKPEGYSTAEEFISAVKTAGALSSNYEDPESHRKYYKPSSSGGASTTDKNEMYLYSMSKGYSSQTLEDGSKSPLYDPDIGTSETEDTITWKDISDYAIMNAEQGIFYTNANQNRKANILETYFVKLLSNISLGLQSLLGLYPVGDLVFNGGARATYYHGLMSYDWASKASGFFIIFQSIALLFVNFSVIRLLHKRTLATIIPSERISLQEGIKDLFVTGAIMLMIFPFINILLRINADIVNILRVMAPNYSFFGLSGGYGVDYNNVGGIILSFVYFFLSAYLNVVFILRAVLVAFLMATSPLFIMSIAFGKKDYFTLWLKELVANIFIQSLYAFVITFFLSIQSSSRTIEVLAISFSLIPLTKMFRSLIFGDSGGLIERAAGGVYGGMTGAAMGLGAAAATGGVAMASNLANGAGSEMLSNAGGAISGMKAGLSSTVNNTVAKLKNKIGSSEGGGAPEGAGGGTRGSGENIMSNPDFAKPRGEKDSEMDTRKENLQNLQNKFGAPEEQAKEAGGENNESAPSDINVANFSGPAPEEPTAEGQGNIDNDSEITPTTLTNGGEGIDTGTEDVERSGMGPEGMNPGANMGVGQEEDEPSSPHSQSPEAEPTSNPTPEPAPEPTPADRAAAQSLNNRVGASNWSKFKTQSQKVGKTIGKGARVVGKGAGRVAKTTIKTIPKAAILGTFAGAVVFNQGVGPSALVPTYGAFRAAKNIMKPKFMRDYEERQEVLKKARQDSMAPVEERGTFKKTKYNDFSRENLQGTNNQNPNYQTGYNKAPNYGGSDMNLRNYKKPQQREAYYEETPSGQKNYKENPEKTQRNIDTQPFRETPQNNQNQQNSEINNNQNPNQGYNPENFNNQNQGNKFQESTQEDLRDYLDSLNEDELVDFLGEEQARLYTESKKNKN